MKTKNFLIADSSSLNYIEHSDPCEHKRMKFYTEH